MPDRLDVLSFRSSAKLPKGDEEQRRIRAMVQEISRDEDAPFSRLIDYWFAAIAWAAHHNLDLPPDDSDGKAFVDIGRGPNFILLESWRIDVLNVLFLLGQDAFMAEPFDPNRVDTTAGRFNENSTPLGGSDVIKNANRYALAGAMPMWDSLVGGGGLDATKAPKQLSAAAAFLSFAGVSGG